MYHSLSMLTFLAFAWPMLSPNAEAGQVLYVADSGDNTIEKIDASGHVSQFAAAGLNVPLGIVVDKAGNVYAGNDSAPTIRMFSPGGTDLGNFATAGQFGVLGLAFDSSGNLYAGSDALVNSILKFSSTGTSLGNFNMTTFTTQVATGLAFDTAGNLYYADLDSNAIHKLSATGADLGVFVSTALTGNIGLAFDRSGNLYVSNINVGSDPFDGTVHEYSSTGTDLGVFATMKGTGIVGLAFDQVGDLYAAGFDSGTIREFSPTGADLGDFATGLSNPAFIAFSPASVPEPHSLILSGFGMVITLSHVWLRSRRPARGNSNTLPLDCV
jgi:DNA-binding beta-propeller fold protein YncE